MTTPTRTVARRRRALTAVALASALVLAGACGEDDDTSTGSAGSGGSTPEATTGGGATDGTTPEASSTGLQQATYVTADHTFDGPDELEAGLVEVTQVNEGEEDHHVQFVKLNDGVTYEQLEEALAGPELTPAMMLVTMMGGPNGAPVGGGESTAIVDLPAGDYLVVCLIPDAEGVPHIAQGMQMRLSVVDGEGEAAEPPETAGTIAVKDMEVVLPDDFAGDGWYEVVNEGPQPHEMVIMQLAEGKTADDLAAWFTTPEGPPPAMTVGGTAVFNPGATMWTKLELEPGDYVATCFFPDITDPAQPPHMAKGMMTPFTIG